MRGDVAGVNALLKRHARTLSAASVVHHAIVNDVGAIEPLIEALLRAHSGVAEGCWTAADADGVTLVRRAALLNRHAALAALLKSRPIRDAAFRDVESSPSSSRNNSSNNSSNTATNLLSLCAERGHTRCLASLLAVAPHDVDRADALRIAIVKYSTDDGFDCDFV